MPSPTPTFLRCAIPTVVIAAALAVGAAPASASLTIRINPDDRTLDVISNGESDDITLRATTGGITVANHGVDQGTFDRNLFEAIEVNGLGGDDDVVISSVPIFTDTERTLLRGGTGADKLQGGNGPETLDGDAGEDDLIGAGGVDTIRGDSDNDTVNGGAGADIIDGGAGDDRIAHRPEDGSDGVAGGADVDQLRFIGTSSREDLHLAQTSTGLAAVSSASRAFRVDSQGVETVVWRGLEGDDSLGTNLPTLPVRVVAEGGFGDDVLEGGPVDDSLSGEEDDDTLIGNAGADALTGGDGVDAFACDGADTVFDFEPGETETACFPVADPPPAREPEPVAPVEPNVPPAPSAPAAPVPPAVTAPSGPGFARPRVVATRTGLKVIVQSTAAQPVTVALRATERRGRKRHRYRAVR